MPTLNAINNTLEIILDGIEDNRISDANAMIDGINNQLEKLRDINLTEESDNDKKYFKQLARKILELEHRLYGDKIEIFRYHIIRILGYKFFES